MLWSRPMSRRSGSVTFRIPLSTGAARMSLLLLSFPSTTGASPMRTASSVFGPASSTSYRAEARYTASRAEAVVLLQLGRSRSCRVVVVFATSESHIALSSTLLESLKILITVRESTLETIGKPRFCRLCRKRCCRNSIHRRSSFAHLPC